jgi:hypothetical protein
MGEMGGTASSGVVAPLITRIIIVQSDGRPLQDRHNSSCRTTRVKKKDCSGDNGEVGERFSSEFCPGRDRADTSSTSSYRGKVPTNEIFGLYSIASCVGTDRWTWNISPIGDATNAAAAAAAIADRVVDTNSVVPRVL